MKKIKQILLTWDAYNNGFIVTAKVLKMLFQEHNIAINEIIYLQNQNLSENNLAEIDLFFEGKNKKVEDEKIRKRLSEIREIRDFFELEKEKLPKFTQKRIEIKSVTNYQSIYDNLRKIIQKFYEKEEVQLHINVSPGTPQMHVVWLMLNSSGFLPQGTVLWSSQWDKQREQTLLEKIKFKPKTFLSEVFEKRYLKNFSININPNETKSQKRKELEDRLSIFSKVPRMPILLLGERGTGKSTYVREYIKQENEEYVELACGTFTDELMRSELFGYKKGAFTGASSDKKGFLSKFSSGGLLFLDEIQDLGKELQRQLMQVLQTGEYYPIGETEKPQIANFRLVAASNMEYGELSKKLDLDFLDRISRFTVEVPPIRECKEDIEMYWEKVWREVGDFEDAPKKIWNQALEKYILSKELKGNFRDLQKLASYVISFYLESHKKDIAVDSAIKEYEKWQTNIDYSNGKSYFKIGSSYNEIIAEFNKDLVEWAIKTYGSKKVASDILNRSESMLNKDLNKNRLQKKVK